MTGSHETAEMRAQYWLGLRRMLEKIALLSDIQSRTVLAYADYCMQESGGRF